MAVVVITARADQGRQGQAMGAASGNTQLTLENMQRCTADGEQARLARVLMAEARLKKSEVKRVGLERSNEQLKLGHEAKLAREHELACQLEAKVRETRHQTVAALETQAQAARDRRLAVEAEIDVVLGQLENTRLADAAFRAELDTEVAAANNRMVEFQRQAEERTLLVVGEASRDTRNVIGDLRQHCDTVWAMENAGAWTDQLSGARGVRKDPVKPMPRVQALPFGPQANNPFSGFGSSFAKAPCKPATRGFKDQALRSLITKGSSPGYVVPNAARSLETAKGLANTAPAIIRRNVNDGGAASPMAPLPIAPARSSHGARPSPRF